MSLCPYCLVPMSETRDAPDQRTEDHVFWKALGGKATVDACRRCNSTIGDEIEGRLSRDNELYTRHEWRGTVIPENDAEPAQHEVVRVDVRTGNAVPKPKVTVETIGGERHYRVEGTREQARRILNDGLARLAGWDVQRIEDEIANAATFAWAPRVRIEISHDLNLGRRLAAKMLLGAGAVADPDFIHTDLAASLRDVLWARLSPIVLLDNAAIEGLADFQQAQPALASGAALLRPNAIATAIYVPMSYGRTAVVVRARNRPIGLSGFLVEGTWRRANGLPVVVEDRRGGATADFMVDSALEWIKRTGPQPPRAPLDAR